MSTPNDIEIAKINTKLDNVLDEIKEIKGKFQGMYSNFAQKDDVDEKMKSLEARHDERLKRLEVIIYSMIGLILTGFIGALIAMVYRK